MTLLIILALINLKLTLYVLSLNNLDCAVNSRTKN